MMEKITQETWRRKWLHWLSRRTTVSGFTLILEEIRPDYFGYRLKAKGFMASEYIRLGVRPDGYDFCILWPDEPDESERIVDTLKRQESWARQDQDGYWYNYSPVSHVPEHQTRFADFHSYWYANMIVPLLGHFDDLKQDKWLWVYRRGGSGHAHLADHAEASKIAKTPVPPSEWHRLIKLWSD